MGAIRRIIPPEIMRPLDPCPVRTVQQRRVRRPAGHHSQAAAPQVTETWMKQRDMPKAIPEMPDAAPDRSDRAAVFIREIIEKAGRSWGTRTHDPRFWRPMLYQLS
jgi:hypothetical protein